VLGILTMVVTYAIHRMSKSESVTLALMFASMLATSRYFYWRVATVAGTLSAGGVNLINVCFMILLLTAETYAFVVLYLGYIQAIRPLRRMPAPLPKELEAWPHVDVLIPTYNEPLSVVRSTAFAALNIDYPGDKMHVYLLDDGKREEFRKFCEDAGVGYITRKDNRHAKAGNINHALGMLSSPYVAIFDCDHVPTRSTTIALPVNLLARNNTLGFEFIGHYTHGCEDPAHTTLWARVETASTLELTGSVLSLGNDLKMLPSPFYDGSTGQGAAFLPFYFASAPGEESLEAAGIVASWFGVLAKSRPFRFPVNVGGDLPKGNFVLFADKVSALPDDLDLHTSGSTIAVRANPVDPYGKVLVIAGENPTQLLTAARALAAGNSVMQGDTARVNNFTLPAPRSADDAPLWLRTDRASPLWENLDQGELQGDGSGPLPVYVRVPPDLYFGDRQHLPMHLDYRYNTVSLAKSSSLRVSANGSLVSELPLPHDDKPKKALSYDAQVPLVSMRPFANTFLFTFYFGVHARSRPSPPGTGRPISAHPRCHTGCERKARSSRRDVLAFSRRVSEAEASNAGWRATSIRVAAAEDS
jgi:hypothetical protein